MSEKKNEYLKKILQEAGADSMDQATQNSLKIFVKNSSLIQSEMQPPVGYEAHLVENLKRQLPKQKEQTRSQNSGGATLAVVGDFFKFLRSPQLAWSISGTLAVFVAVFLFAQKMNISSKNSTIAARDSSSDLLSRAVSRVGQQETGEWLASVGDSGMRAKSNRSLSSLADEMESAKNQDAIDRALIQVAHEMGMNDL